MIESFDWYSLFRWNVAAASARQTVSAAARPTTGCRELTRDVQARYAQRTTSTTSAASGRYIRRSAPTSVAIGTKLDVGDSVMKHHAPRKPTCGRRTSRTTTTATS